MRQRKDFQRIEGVKSSRLIVIAAEGRATEKMTILILPMSIARLRISWMNTTSWMMTNCGLLLIVTTGRKIGIITKFSAAIYYPELRQNIIFFLYISDKSEVFF